MCPPKHVCAQLALLVEEKKCLLLHSTAAAANPTNTGSLADMQQTQLRHQMNDLNRRLHGVVQRMSSYDRYKRKKKKTTRDQASLDQLSPPAQETAAAPETSEKELQATTVTTVGTQSPENNPTVDTIRADRRIDIGACFLERLDQDLKDVNKKVMDAATSEIMHIFDTAKQELNVALNVSLEARMRRIKIEGEWLHQWMVRLPLVKRRRANQSANAG